MGRRRTAIRNIRSYGERKDAQPAETLRTLERGSDAWARALAQLAREGAGVTTKTKKDSPAARLRKKPVECSCSECGKRYTTHWAGRNTKKTCGAEACQRERRNRLKRERKAHKKSKGVDLPKSETRAMVESQVEPQPTRAPAWAEEVVEVEVPVVARHADPPEPQCAEGDACRLYIVRAEKLFDLGAITGSQLAQVVFEVTARQTGVRIVCPTV